HAGGTKSALRGVARDEFALQLRKLAAFREALDGLHRLAGNLGRKREAAARRAAVDHDGASATDAVLAAEMGSGQLHVLSQEVREVPARLDAPFQRLAVQSRFDGDVFLPEEVGHGVTFSDNELSTRRVSTVAMWSLVSARSPVVSSGVRSCRIACYPIAPHGRERGQANQGKIALAARQLGESHGHSRLHGWKFDGDNQLAGLEFSLEQALEEILRLHLAFADDAAERERRAERYGAGGQL